ncbi:MAG: cation transporter [Proteobacteria bacterium]|nr:cation transporter [Pseudomonadota bacterium]
MSETTINIDGMSCQHCVMSVKKAIGALKGVEQSDVAVGNAVVKYDDSQVKKEEIEAAIEKVGFKVKK